MSLRRKRRHHGKQEYPRDATAYLAAKRASDHCGNGQCLIPKTHLRLQDCHDQWHTLVGSYHRPSAFRRELNTIIQSLRNVTFILQAEKSKIPDFAEWYKQWQSLMRDSELMRWVLESRNRIVKSGDLEAESVATVALVTGYWEGEPPEGLEKVAGPRGPIEVPTNASRKEQLRQLKDLPNFFAREGYVELRRQWVDSALPGYELAEACAEAYSFLLRMIGDLHRHLGILPFTTVAHGDYHYWVDEPSSMRLPCMFEQEFAVDRLKLSNGAVDVGGTRFTLIHDPTIEDLARKRYRDVGMPVNPRNVKSVADLAEWYMDCARAIMKKDRHHGHYAFLFIGTGVVASEILMARDKPDKIVMMRKLAKTVEASRIDGIIKVGDTWLGKWEFDAQGYPISPAFQANRKEAISVVAEDAYGNRKYLVSLYMRRGRRVVFDSNPFDATDSMVSNDLQPIREAWKRMNLGTSSGEPPG